MKNSRPSVDPSNLGTLTGAFRHIFNKLMLEIDGMLPARVITGGRDVVEVEPLVTMLTSNNQRVPRGKIASVPVLQLGAGGFMMNFNVVAGSLGWIQANDRDISLFLQSYSSSPPNSLRVKDFADAVFIPGVLTGYTIDEEDEDAMVLQSLDNSVKIALSTGKIKIKAPVVEVEAGAIAINSTGPVSMTTPTFAVTGNITATGTITPGA